MAIILNLFCLVTILQPIFAVYVLDNNANIVSTSETASEGSIEGIEALTPDTWTKLVEAFDGVVNNQGDFAVDAQGLGVLLAVRLDGTEQQKGAVQKMCVTGRHLADGGFVFDPLQGAKYNKFGSGEEAIEDLETRQGIWYEVALGFAHSYVAGMYNVFQENDLLPGDGEHRYGFRAGLIYRTDVSGREDFGMFVLYAGFFTKK